MSSTHLSLNVHVIYSTHNRRPVIADQWRADLHSYLGGCVRGTAAQSLIVGGIADHVHLLLRMRATQCLADLLRDVKSGSSLWVHKSQGQPSFGWQDGYAGIAVSPSDIPRVFSYIQHQEEHHRKKTFQEEYEEMLRASGIEYDPKYLW